MTSEKIITLKLTKEQLELLKSALSRASQSLFEDERTYKALGDSEKAPAMRADMDAIEMLRATFPDRM